MMTNNYPFNVMFDTNTWQKSILPQSFPQDRNLSTLLKIHSAIQKGDIKGFISKSVITVEAHLRKYRHEYFDRVARHMTKISEESIVGNKIRGRINFGGQREEVEPLKPVLIKRLEIAFSLGFKLVPISRFGTIYPPGIDYDKHTISLPSSDKENIWAFLENQGRIISDIEARGVGFAAVKNIASRLRQKHGLKEEGWFTGLELARDQNQQAEIANAFSEWADGDAISSCIAYGIDYFCTEDLAKSTKNSILSPENRAWLSRKYGLSIVSLNELQRRLQ